MTDELVLNGKTYVSSRKAAEQTGYARDYIGQLSRGGLIEAERVGGLWYVALDSLEGYEKNSDAAKMITAAPQTREAESTLVFEGKDYISASRASKLSGYNQDYVGQLARGGKIASRQIGNRWYVDREALLTHKREKDALLAAVQTEAVGLKASESPQRSVVERSATPVHDIHYVAEERDLMPIPKKHAALPSGIALNSEIFVPRSSILPPKQIVSTYQEPVQLREMPLKTSSKSKKVLIRGTVGALTIILMLSVGLVTVSDNAAIAHARESIVQSNAAAAANSATDVVGDFVEDIVSPALTYERAARWQ